MKTRLMLRPGVVAGLLVLALILLVVACSGSPAEQGVLGPDSPPAAGAGEQDDSAAEDILTIPELQPADLDSRPLRVIATTSIIGDVVGRVGGDSIELSTLIGPGQDPHSYEPAARDLTAVAQADVIFVNGWDLEEALVEELATIGQDVPLIPVSAGITPLKTDDDQGDHHAGEEEEEHGHGDVDPHVWFDVENVRQWTANIRQVLSNLDPENAARYDENASAYQIELQELDRYARNQLGRIAPEERNLVTNHKAWSYLARAYDLTVLGTVIPAASTLSEPSAGDMVDLIAVMDEHGVCTIFSETTVSDTMAQTVASELDHCAEVKVLPLYTGALGPPGSEADSYAGMFRANIGKIVEGLTQ